MKAYVFLCGEKTENECLQRLLFGTNDPVTYEKFRGIRPGDLLFLYNYDVGKLQGPFRALSQCGQDIEQDAWKDARTGGFPYQVRVDDSPMFRKPLTADELPSSIRLVPHSKLGLKPPEVLSEKQTAELLRAFQRKNDDSTPIERRGYEATGGAYIFRCNRETGAKCFDENIMGAPAKFFRSIVSKIQPGDMIFVWVLDENRLYGLWRAKSRGQYFPGAFTDSGGDYPAVVFCERSLDLTSGIDEGALRSIVPFDGPLPPYRITPEQGQQLVEALINVNGDEEPTVRRPAEGLRTLDGHIVKSRGEAMIDNWLFQRGIVHAYDYLLTVESKPLRSDFFIPAKGVYIEFWGLSGDEQYDKRRRVKVDLYRKGGHRLIEISPADFALLDDRLLELL